MLCLLASSLCGKGLPETRRQLSATHHAHLSPRPPTPARPPARRRNFLQAFASTIWFTPMVIQLACLSLSLGWGLLSGAAYYMLRPAGKELYHTSNSVALGVLSGLAAAFVLYFLGGVLLRWGRGGASGVGRGGAGRQWRAAALVTRGDWPSHSWALLAPATRCSTVVIWRHCCRLTDGTPSSSCAPLLQRARRHLCVLGHRPRLAERLAPRGVRGGWAGAGSREQGAGHRGQGQLCPASLRRPPPHPWANMQLTAGSMQRERIVLGSGPTLQPIFTRPRPITPPAPARPSSPLLPPRPAGVHGGAAQGARRRGGAAARRRAGVWRRGGGPGAPATLRPALRAGAAWAGAPGGGPGLPAPHHPPRPARVS